jgi:hypothetical protein
MFIPDPEFYPSQIPDLRSPIQKFSKKEKVERKLVVIPSFVATN